MDTPKTVGVGDFLFMLRCFDVQRWKEYTPDPGLFLTREDAEKAAASMSSEAVFCTIFRVRIGRIS